MDYDTAEIRRVAGKVGSTASSLSSLTQESLGRIASELPGQFKGQASDALQEAVGNLMHDLYQISNGLRGVRDALYAYADRLDEADRRARDFIRNR